MNLAPMLNWASAILWHLSHPESRSREGIQEYRMTEKLGWLRDFAPCIQSWQECQEVIATALTFINQRGIFRGAAKQFHALGAPLVHHSLSRQLLQTTVVFCEARTKTTAERVFADEHRDSGIQFRTLQTIGKATLQKRIHGLVVGLSHIASAYDAPRSDGQLAADQDYRREAMDCNALAQHGRLQAPTYVPRSKSQTPWKRNASPRSSLETFIRPPPAPLPGVPQYRSARNFRQGG